MNPNEYESNHMLLTKLKELTKENCTFVDTWDSHEICPGVFCLYGEKYPAKKASN